MKRLIFYTVFFLSVAASYSQPTEKQPFKFDKSKLEYGGNLGLSIGSNATSIIIAPQLGYRFDPRFSAGAGVNYSYYSYSSNKLNYTGFNIYGRVRPFNPFVLQVQQEIYRMWGSIEGESVSEIVPAFLGGAGITIPFGSSGGMTMMIFYDLAQNKYSPYGNRLFYSVGYTFGF